MPQDDPKIDDPLGVAQKALQLAMVKHLVGNAFCVEISEPTQYAALPGSQEMANMPGIFMVSSAFGAWLLDDGSAVDRRALYF